MITHPLSLILLLIINHEGILLAYSFFAEPINNQSRRLLAPVLSLRATTSDEKGGEQEQTKTPMFFASQLETNENDEREIIGDYPRYLSSLDSSDERRSLILNKEDREEEEENEQVGLGLPYSKEISEFISKPQSELIDAGLVLLSSFIVAIDTLPQTSLPDFLNPTIIYTVEELLSYFFGIGYLLRWYAVGNLSFKYFTKPLPFIDFFASVMPLLLTIFIPFLGVPLPTWIASNNNSALVNLRLLRILRLQELLVDIETFSGVAQTLQIESGNVRPYQLQLARVLISVFTLFSIATGLIYTAEHEVNSLIPDYFTAAYFGLTTLTTVGFGDITPITLNGRLVVMGSILVGVAVIPAQAAELVNALLDLQAERRQKDLMKNTLRTRMEGSGFVDDMVDPRISCPSCGKRSHRSDAFYCYFCGEKLWQ